MEVPFRRIRRSGDIEGTGVIATIEGTAPDAYAPDGTARRRVALRADIDALPVTEQTGADYTSLNEGVMHACGHDCHIAMTLGACRILTEMRDALHGEVRVLFQPAEEVSTGSRYLMDAGALDGVDAIYGAHIWSELDAGLISCEAGPRMANCDWFRIEIEGTSAHGSMPHRGVDAIVVGAAMVNLLQVLVSREISPFEPVVVTVGEFNGGQARNIVAGTVVLTGTIRSWSEHTRTEVPERLDRIVTSIAEAFGAKARFSFSAGNPAVVNDADCAAVAREAVVKVLGDEAVGSYRGTLSGEDFSEYLRAVPGCFAFIGTRNPEVGATHPQHSCFYTVDESVLAKGSMVAAQWAHDMLARP